MKSLKDLNKLARPYNIELVKGEGYFYWWAFDERNVLNRLPDTAVPVCHFTHQTFEGWKRELVMILDKMALLYVNENTKY